MLIPREYFTLNEVLADWGISESELGYVVEMGQLTLSGVFMDPLRWLTGGRDLLNPFLTLRGWWILSGVTQCVCCASKRAL